MQLARREVGIRRIVLVEAANGRVAEENASTPIRLQAVLMRIDNDGVSLRSQLKCPARGLVEMCRDKAKVASIGGVEVNAKYFELAARAIPRLAGLEVPE